MGNAFTMDYACDKLKEDQKAFNPEIEYISNKVKEAERHKETSCEPSYDGTTLLGHLDAPPCNTPDAGKTLADEVASVLNSISCAIFGVPTSTASYRRSGRWDYDGSR